MKKIKQLILIPMCTIGTFLSSLSVYAAPPEFTPEDDALIKAFAEVETQSAPESFWFWFNVAKLVPHLSPGGCMARWNNYIRPTFDRWTHEEEELLLAKYEELGPQWEEISNFFKYKNFFKYRSAKIVEKRYVSLRHELKY